MIKRRIETILGEVGMAATLSPLFTWRSAVSDPGSPLTATQRLVGFALSMHMNEAGGSCFPSQATLAARTALSERAVRDAVGALEQAGFLRVTRERLPSGRWSVSHYEACVPGTSFQDPAAPPEPSAAGPPEPNDISPPERRSADLDKKPKQRDNPDLVKAAPKNGARKRDPIWDALVHVFGEPSTSTERTLYGKVRKELSDAEATGEQVVERAREAWRRWGQAFSPAALPKHWTSLAQRIGRQNGNSRRSVTEAFAELDERIGDDLRGVEGDRGPAVRGLPEHARDA